MFGSIKRTVKKASRCIGQAQCTLKRANDVATKDVVPTLTGIRSLVADFSKTSGLLRGLVEDVRIKTPGIMSHLDEILTDFDEVIRSIDGLVTGIHAQAASVNTNQLNEISGKALDLIESSVNIAATIEAELPQFSSFINVLFKKAFRDCEIIIEKTTSNLDQLQHFLSNLGVIAQDVGDASVQLLTEARLVFRDADLEVKRTSYNGQLFFQEATKTANKVNLLTDSFQQKIEANKMVVAETANNMANISRIANNGLQGAIVLGILGFVYKCIPTEDNLRTPVGLSMTDFMVLGFCMFGMMAMLKTYLSASAPALALGSSIPNSRPSSSAFLKPQPVQVPFAEREGSVDAGEVSSEASSLDNQDQEKMDLVYKNAVGGKLG